MKITNRNQKEIMNTSLKDQLTARNSHQKLLCVLSDDKAEFDKHIA